MNTTAWRGLLLVVLPLALQVTSARAAQPFEGVWATSRADCRNTDGPSSRTLIDYTTKVDGKPTPIFDQYEHHCRIDRTSSDAATTTLAVTCFEFWEEFYKRVEGRPATIKLSQHGRQALTIDGKRFLSCTR